MPKLYFKYGTMNSSKTANLLMKRHNYLEYNSNVLLLKPVIDNRDGVTITKSRALEKGVETDLLIYPETEKLDFNLSNISCILVDEAQFLTKKNVDMLRKITETTPVICYGLKTDYKTNLFEGSKRLIEVADSIEEIKSICFYCQKKAIFTGKFKTTKGGKQILIKYGTDEPEIGGNDIYKSLCYNCYTKK